MKQYKLTVNSRYWTRYPSRAEWALYNYINVSSVYRCECDLHICVDDNWTLRHIKSS